MARSDAVRLLGLPADCREEELERALREETQRMRLRLARARTNTAQARYRRRVEELEQVARSLGVAQAVGAGPEAFGEDDGAAGAALRCSSLRDDLMGEGWCSESQSQVDTIESRPLALTRHARLLAAGVGVSLAAALLFWWGQRPVVHEEPHTGLSFVQLPGTNLWVGRQEVTHVAFARFIQATSYLTDAERRGECIVYANGSETLQATSWRTSFSGSVRRPVTCVSWNDAQAFAAWLSEVDPTGRYRLPTQIEWDRAAGTTAYSFGDDAGRISRYANVAGRESAFPWAASGGAHDEFPGIAPVASFRADKQGLYDLHGNVWEWSQDAHSRAGYKMIRGGGWASHPANAATAVRNGLPASGAANDTGFRLVRVPSPAVL